MKSTFPVTTMFAALVVGCAQGEPPSNAPAPVSSRSEIAAPTRSISPGDVERVSVQDARARVQAGQALLVIAYPGEERFRQSALDGAISYDALEERIPALDAHQEIIFYCG